MFPGFSLPWEQGCCLLLGLGNISVLWFKGLAALQLLSGTFCKYCQNYTSLLSMELCPPRIISKPTDKKNLVAVSTVWILIKLILWHGSFSWRIDFTYDMKTSSPRGWSKNWRKGLTFLSNTKICNKRSYIISLQVSMPISNGSPSHVPYSWSMNTLISTIFYHINTMKLWG